MRVIILFLVAVLINLSTMAQQDIKKHYDYAYAKYNMLLGLKCDVYIQFSADSVINYLALKKEKKVDLVDVLSHSFEVIRYMESLDYNLISVSSKNEANGFVDESYKLLLVFKKERNKP